MGDEVVAGQQLHPSPCEGALQPGGEMPSPRLRRIINSLNLTPSQSILTCEAAASMDVEAFGARTEDVREWALHELASCAQWTKQPTAVPAAAATALVLVPDNVLAVAVPPATPPGHEPHVLTAAAAASAAATAGQSFLAAVLAPEEQEIERAVEEFFRVVPEALLLHSSSALPSTERIAARRRHLLTCGASSVRAGTAFVRRWLQFCDYRSIPSFGLPVDADLLNAFLSEVDDAARQRAAGKRRQTGASVQHSMACAARWTADHAGLPFGAAKLQSVRKTSQPQRESEPSWSEMWEPAVLVHLLRLALDAQQRDLVRAMAASAYLVCAASMRLIGGLRSAPPVADGSGVFHGVAVLSKGKRRSSMAPRPWSVPSVSPDGSFTDHDVAAGLREALSRLPVSCCSMFPRLLNETGAEVALERAIAVCPSARAASPQLETTLTYLLSLPPLSLSKTEARRIASRKHGPRHLLPEVARVMGLPLPARNELGLWADSKLRMQSMPNRYSRDAERLLSSVLRGMILRHIRSRMPSFRRITLQHLVASPSEMQPPPSAPMIPVIMGGGTDDKFAAYRAVVTLHPGFTVVMVARPSTATPCSGQCAWEECFFRVPGHNFGLASAVLNFYHVAEPPTVFSRLFFGTPVTRYYDDHGVHEPSYGAGSGQACHIQLHELLRFHFDIAKHAPWSRSVVYTGVRTDWSRDESGLVTVGVSRSRRDSVRQLIADAFASGILSAATASSLRGKARFCLCPVFGRVGLAAVHLLGKRQKEADALAIDDELAEVLRFLDVVVDKLPDFEVRFRKESVLPAVVVLSDASWETNYSWLGFLAVCPLQGAYWAGSPTPAWLLQLLRSHKLAGSYIGQLELAAAAAPYFSLPEGSWRDRAVMHYIDNQGACYGLIHGRSQDTDANRLVFVTSMRAAMLRCDVWYDYVPSASNIADLPTRLDAKAFARLEAIARRVPLRLPPEWCLACPHSELARLFV